MKRIETFQNAGYKVFYIWENDYLQTFDNSTLR